MDESAKNQKKSELYKQYVRQLRNESDRGSVIVSASLMDDILVQLIKAKLAPSIEKRDELFDNASAPFSTFSARIDLAYRLGLLRPQVRASLHLLRKIRNDFAHAINPLDFESDSTKSRIQELFKLNKDVIEAMFQEMDEIDGFQELKHKLTDRIIFETFIAISAAYMLVEVHEVSPIETLI